MMVGGAARGMQGLRAETVGLWQLAAAAGLRFGSSSDVEIANAPSAYSSAFAEHCELLAPNMGWHRVAATPGATRPNWEDPNIGFARNHSMHLTGGHLLWHEALPAYFTGCDDARRAQDLMRSHIRMMAGHYAGQAFSWNVVNEAIDTKDGDKDGLRRSPLLEKLGPDYIAEAFHVAHEAKPGALLAYNDAHFEMDTQHDEARRAALLRLLDRLARDKTPIDAVGLQTHIRLDGSRFDTGIYRQFLRDVAARGVRILITELDVFDIGVAGSLAERDATVAGVYRDALAVILDEPAVASVVTWGLSDRYTWLVPHSDASYIRPDGQPPRPLPLDADFRPKPAFNAVAAALRKARMRKRA